MEGEMKGGGTERMCRALNYLYKKITSEQFQGESVRWYTHTQTQAHTGTRTHRNRIHFTTLLFCLFCQQSSLKASQWFNYGC